MDVSELLDRVDQEIALYLNEEAQAKLGLTKEQAKYIVRGFIEAKMIIIRQYMVDDSLKSPI